MQWNTRTGDLQVVVELLDNKKVLSEVLRKLTIKIDGGAEIPILNRMTEKIEINCTEGAVGDLKITTRMKH